MVERLLNSIEVADLETGDFQPRREMLEGRLTPIRLTPLMLTVLGLRKAQLSDEAYDGHHHLLTVTVLLKFGARPSAKDICGKVEFVLNEQSLLTVPVLIPGNSNAPATVR
jgi:hypothetical protein